MIRSLRLVAGIATWLALAPAARAADASACIQHHESGQLQRKQGHFIAAREQFLACATRECPAIIQSDCTTLASEMDAAIPSVVLAAVDPRGDDLRGATVRIDGAEPRVLDGRALSLDPGAHRFVFEAPGAAAQEVPVELREADRFRRVGAVLDTGPPSDDGLRIHPLALVFGGVGAVATASFAIFALNGKATERDIRTCSACTSEDVDKMRTQYLIADVSLAVALLSFSVSTWFFLHPPEDDRRKGETAGGGRLRVEWAPAVAPGVAVLTARGTF
jgi:hypothetical protein